MSLELKSTAEYLRASHISRWGIVQTSHRQNIAEHQYRVWLLTRHWGKIAGLTKDEQINAEELALVHDLPEIRTGDAPTPHKTPEIKAFLSQVEHQILPELAALEERVTSRAKDLVKFCDTAEAILFLKVNGLGKHAEDVQALLEEQMLGRLRKSTIGLAAQNRLIEAFITTKHDT